MIELLNLFKPLKSLGGKNGDFS